VPCRMVFDLVTSSAFDGFITFVIILNVGWMAGDYWGMSPEAAVMYDQGTNVFIYIYYVECVLKIFGLGVRGYFGDGWCRFDFFLVCTALFDSLSAGNVKDYLPLPPYLLRVLRVFRILRILRLLKGAKDLRNLLVTMILSFPSLINVGSLTAVVVFIYAVLGLHLFTFLEPGEVIDEQRNFETLSSSSFVLFQCLTGDAWSGLMNDAMLDEGSGLCSAAEGNCGSIAALPYFISFQVVGVFVCLNLVIAVILENFSSLGSQNPDVVSASDIENFKETWAEFDPDADNYIPSKDLPRLVLALPPPMGLRGVGDQSDAIKLCTQLENMTQVDGQISFQDVLSALTRYSFFNKKSSLNKDELESLEAPPKLTAPPVPKISPEKSKANAEKSSAEQFAEDLPSVRRVFALQVIEKYAAGWTEIRQRGKNRLQARISQRNQPGSTTGASPPKAGGRASPAPSQVASLSKCTPACCPSRGLAAPSAAGWSQDAANMSDRSRAAQPKPQSQRGRSERSSSESPSAQAKKPKSKTNRG